MAPLDMHSDPHRDQTVIHAGAAVAQATAAIVLLHGRGASAESILPLASEFRNVPDFSRLAFVAPQAFASTWYPNSFLAPRESNEPWLTSALNKVESVVSSLVEGGIARNRIVVCGFSQGACLASEFVASHPARYAGLIAFTGGLIGPPGEDLHHAGSLEGTSALFLSGDPDPHVPWARAEESAKIYEQMGAVVHAEKFPNRPHTISGQEIRIAQEFLISIFKN